MKVPEPWTCPSCSIAVSTPYCPACGERRPHPDELTLAGLVAQALDAFTSYDTRLMLTLRRLVGRPGNLSLMYLQGSRKPYIGPFALFVLANVLFVAMEALTGSNIFASSLAEHMYEQPWDFFAPELVARRLDAMGTTLEAYTPLFDLAVAVHAKSLIILMVLPFACLPAVVFAGKRLPFAAYLAFSLHFHAFMLVLFSAALVVTWLDVQVGGPGLASQWLDNVIAMTSLLVCAIYLYIATGTVYNSSGWPRLGTTLFLTLAAMLVFFGYRFMLFILTLYST